MVTGVQTCALPIFSGGIFRDMTIHDFDTARFFLGEIEEVYDAAWSEFHDKFMPFKAEGVFAAKLS